MPINCENTVRHLDVTFARILNRAFLVNAAKKHSSKLASWGFTNAEPFLIAGPCSAESEEQILQTAQQIKAGGKASVFRAGAWKPRTRPGSFEGIGSVALEWMSRAKAETGLPMATEVANAWHVEEVLKHGIDMIWIGARTTVNPFYVQEIANALQGVDIPVLVKNPLHPELGLWVGAIERFDAVGIKRLAAIHRGFYTTKPSPFRNEPHWDLSFELRARLPELPILCDPSHIAGKRALLQQVAQTAMDINLDGLMIETHITPDKALSDAEQQVTPSALVTLMDNLVVKQEDAEEETVLKKLQDLRLVIDDIDHELIKSLSKRFKHVEEIGNIKLEDHITIFQIKRWFEMMNDRKAFGAKYDLDVEFLHELFSIIHKYSVKKQTEIVRKDAF